MNLLLAPKTAPVWPSLGDVVVNARDVGVRIGGKTIVEGIDLEIRAGEIVALVGPNGAGKSTLLSAIAGDRSYSGSVELDGRAVSSWSNAELAIRRAVLRQDNAVSFPFTVLEIVSMGRAPWQRITTPREDERIIGEELVRTDSLRFSDRTFGSLSGGEKARVSLARALAQRTPLILLDEPTAALDVNFQELVLAIARQVAREGAAVGVVLHDLAAAAAYADRVLLLSKGKSVAHGAPKDVFTGELLSDVYGHPIRVLRHGTEARPELFIVPERYSDSENLGDQHSADQYSDAQGATSAGSSASTTTPASSGQPLEEQ